MQNILILHFILFYSPEAQQSCLEFVQQPSAGKNLESEKGVGQNI